MALNQADIAFLFICTGLVFLMTPGLAFFYGGLVRKKNVLSMMAKNFVIIALVSMIWFICAFSEGFATGNGFIGGMAYFGFMGVGWDANAAYSTQIPLILYAAYQMMFAIITVAIISSAVAERVKFSSFLVFATVWLILVYSPVAHWVWGDGGWLHTLGALDFAGGTVVHINCGFAALALAIVIGPRKNYKKEPMDPSNIPYVLLGLGLLWIGWFAFNGGSELAADPRAVQAMLNTHMAACAAGLMWMGIGWKQTGKASLLGFATGALAGLVAITPAAGFVDTWAAIVIGLGSGSLCYFTLLFRNTRTKIDESLDAWAVHGCGGVWGAIATGIFASGAISVGGVNGLIFGNAYQVWIQAIGVMATMVYSFGVTFVIAWVINKTLGLRVKDEEEYVGLDITQHGETLS